MDYYKILNVSSDASLKEIEQAYKDLSSFYNPENNVSKNALKRYREVNEAYKVLSEIKQREMYDKFHLNDLKEEEKEEREFIGIKSYLNSSSVFSYGDEIVSKESVNDIYLEVKLPYLYYLCGSEYTFGYSKEVLTYLDKDCPNCKGKGKVRKDNKVCVCPNCKGKGKDSSKSVIEEKITVECNGQEVMIDKDEYKIFVKFDFFDKDFYRVENNEIFIDYVVSEEDYQNGIDFTLKKDDFTLMINSVSFSNITYTFLDKIIHYNFILNKYAGKDIEAYLLTNEKLIYLNLNDFSYSSISDKEHTYKLNVDSNLLTLEGLGTKGYNDKNGNLIVHVINVKNEIDTKLFFNKKIKKVSALLFKLKGSYNNHFFKSNKEYDYDDKYIYLPSKAYKLASKNYLVFRIIYSLLYLIIPCVLYFIMGFNLAFVIVTLAFFAIYLIAINLLMEVKV